MLLPSKDTPWALTRSMDSVVPIEFKVKSTPAYAGQCASSSRLCLGEYDLLLVSSTIEHWALVERPMRSTVVGGTGGYPDRFSTKQGAVGGTSALRKFTVFLKGSRPGYFNLLYEQAASSRHVGFMDWRNSGVPGLYTKSSRLLLTGKTKNTAEGSGRWVYIWHMDLFCLSKMRKYRTTYLLKGKALSRIYFKYIPFNLLISVITVLHRHSPKLK